MTIKTTYYWVIYLLNNGWSSFFKRTLKYTFPATYAWQRSYPQISLFIQQQKLTLNPNQNQYWTMSYIHNLHTGHLNNWKQDRYLGLWSSILLIQAKTTHGFPHEDLPSTWNPSSATTWPPHSQCVLILKYIHSNLAVIAALGFLHLTKLKHCNRQGRCQGDTEV